MDQLLAYAIRISPGLSAAIVLLSLLPREQTGARLCVHLGLFILVRDAMTPVGLWEIGAAPLGSTLAHGGGIFLLASGWAPM